MLEAGIYELLSAATYFEAMLWDFLVIFTIAK